MPLSTEPPSTRYDILDAEKIIQTVSRLKNRIRERFGPERGLYSVCQRLLEIASQAQQRSRWIARPVISLRIASTIISLLIVVVFVLPAFFFKVGTEHLDELSELIQVLEPAMNVMVLIGATIFFLATLEIRVKRRRALRAIHELRSIAHIIDMHQLTKDPERLRPGIQLTASSPQPDMTPFLLGRYLDYCSELLSLTGKVAALYVQRFDDSVAIASANELEHLCTGLARKIWQKIIILQTMTAGVPSGQQTGLVR